MWMLAAQWQRIAQEEAFLSRTIETGDQLAWRLVSGRLSRELMRLWFLFHSSYWPYPKWFGTAFYRLPNATLLGDALTELISAINGDVAQSAFATALEIAGHKHNELGISARRSDHPPVPLPALSGYCKPSDLPTPAWPKCAIRNFVRHRSSARSTSGSTLPTCSRSRIEHHARAPFTGCSPERS